MGASFAPPDQFDRPPRSVNKKSKGVLVSRNIIIKGRRTSVRLAHPTWQALLEISERQKATIHEVCTTIAERKPNNMSTTTAIRLFVLGYYRRAATEDGHRQSGHFPKPGTHLGDLVQVLLAASG